MSLLRYNNALLTEWKTDSISRNFPRPPLPKNKGLHDVTYLHRFADFRLISYLARLHMKSNICFCLKLSDLFLSTISLPLRIVVLICKDEVSEQF